MMRPRTGGIAASPHRLGLVVERVADGDARGAEPLGPGLERRIACRARSGLDGARPHVHPLDLDGHAEPRSEIADERRVRRRLRAQAVIDVNDVERETPRRRQRVQEMEQRDGVGAAGDGHQHALAAGEHRVAAQGLLYPPCKPTQTSPSSKCSFFHTGTVRLSVSIA
jgi:hypothetical protein